MESTGKRANDSSKEETPLIRGLPDDIALLCLARVPRTYHAQLKCVSKRWRELVCGEEWLVIRKKYNLEETWVYVVCQDWESGTLKYCCVLDPYASRKCWKRIQDLPPCILQRHYMEFQVLGTKAYLIGGSDCTEDDWSDSSDDDDNNVADEVYCYDTITNSWSKAAPLPTPRFYLASQVLDGKIYAFGSELNPYNGRTWETYDPATSICTALSDHLMSYHSTLVFNGKIYAWDTTTVDGLSDVAHGAVYDPSTGTWHDEDTGLVSGLGDLVVVADGRLYSFHQRRHELRMWKEDRKKWVLVVELESYLWRNPPYFLAAIDKSILFIGNGLVTKRLDVSNTGGLMISDVTRTVTGGRPISCKCMTI